MTPADLDALVERLNSNTDKWYCREAAAALVQLREENARLLHSKQYACLAHVGEVNKGGPCVWCDLVNLRDSEALARGKIAEQMIEIARLSKVERECFSNPEAWTAWCDVRVLERAERAEAELARGKAGAEKELTDTTERLANAEAEVARLTEMDAYNTDIIARFEAKLTAAEARISDLEVVLHSSRTILGNMAAENKDAIFNRWPIKHEPLRADARNLLPLIDKVLYGE